MSCEGLRQGDAPATIYFNVPVARVYMKQLRILDGGGVLFAVADDVKILAPPGRNIGHGRRLPRLVVVECRTSHANGQKPHPPPKQACAAFST